MAYVNLVSNTFWCPWRMWMWVLPHILLPRLCCFTERTPRSWKHQPPPVYHASIASQHFILTAIAWGWMGLEFIKVLMFYVGMSTWIQSHCSGNHFYCVEWGSDHLCEWWSSGIPGRVRQANGRQCEDAISSQPGQLLGCIAWLPIFSNLPDTCHVLP